jgi:cysteine desulfurase/selenocysteine lyase
MIDIDSIRADFPILRKEIHGHPLIYLDNAATTQKPRQVLDKILSFYSETYGNVHRGVYRLSDEASAAYEGARERTRRFINASAAREIVFTRGTTEAINLVADSFGRAFVTQGDEIIVTEMEHHSNIIPWQFLCERQGAVLKVLPFDDDGNLQLDRLETMFTEKTRLVAVGYVSNVLGTINDVARIIAMARARQVPVLVDGAQAVQHMPVDVQELNCDFFAFSGHKMYAGTGIGVLYGKEKWLDAMPPYQGGGGMIERVDFHGTTFAELPYKFEAGTGSIGAAISLGAAMDYLNRIGLPAIAAHEQEVLDHAAGRLAGLAGVNLYGNEISRCGAISFNLEGIHPFDAGSVLDKLGIAIRTGAHCAEPVMRHYGVSGMMRASIGLYNTIGEIDRLMEGLSRVQRLLKP